MKPRFWTVVPALLLLAPSPARAQGFEGAITFRMQGERGMEMVQLIKGDKVRMEMGGRGQEGIMIMDAGAQNMMMIMPSEKMYMVMDMRGGPGRPEGQGETPKITKLGTSETIAGRTCENYLVGDKQDMEVCAAKGMGFYMSGGGGPGMGRNPMGRVPNFRDAAIMREFQDGFFPLRITRVAGGKREVMLEATRIEPKTLDAALFQAPAGYQQMTMPAGMPGGRP